MAKKRRLLSAEPAELESSKVRRGTAELALRDAAKLEKSDSHAEFNEEIIPDVVIKNLRRSATGTPVEVDENLDWKSVGGLTPQIRQLKEVAILPLIYPQLVTQLGIQPIRGVLLHGPPGTGKTHTVRCLTGALRKADVRVSLFVRKGGDMLSKWVGEGEKQLRDLFEEAQRAQPAVIFLDEIDGLAPVRSARSEQHYASIVATLLSLMDGLQDRGQVLVIGATNRPDSIDEALRRPGRFDREIYFGVPEAAERAEILAVHTKKWPHPLAAPVLSRWSEKHLAGCTGADIAAICNEAGLAAVRRSLPQLYEEDIVRPSASMWSTVCVTERDLEAAHRLVKPTLSRGARCSILREVAPQWRALMATAIKEMVTRIEGSKGCKERLDYSLECHQHPVTKLVAAAALKEVSLPVFSLDRLSASETGEPFLTFMHRQVQMAITQSPSVIYVPYYDTYHPVDPEIILDTIPPHCSVCILCTWSRTSTADDARKVPLPGKYDLEKFWACVLEDIFRRVLDNVWEKVSAEREETRRDLADAADAEGEANPAEEVKEVRVAPADKLKDLEREEEYMFRLLRFQIGECLEGLMKDPVFKDLVHERTDRDYLRHVKKPICLKDIDTKNINGEYTDLDAVKADLDLIRENALAVSKDPKMDPKQRKELCYMLDSFGNFCLLKLDQIDKVVIRGCAKALKRRTASERPSGHRPSAGPPPSAPKEAVPAEARNDDLPPKIADMLCLVSRNIASRFTARSKNLFLDMSSHSKKIECAVETAVSKQKMKNVVKYIEALFAKGKEHFGVGDAKVEFGSKLEAACLDVCEEVKRAEKA